MDEETARRFEDIEGKIDELQDLQLNNKIDILELKAILRSLSETGKLPAEGMTTALGVSATGGQMPKGIPEALDKLFKSVANLQNKITAMEEEMRRMKGVKQTVVVQQPPVRPPAPKPAPQPAYKPPVFKPAPVPAFRPASQPTPTPTTVVGEIEVTELENKIKDIRRLVNELR